MPPDNGAYGLGTPAVMAGAQALAELSGVPINQSLLRDSEACISAAVCQGKSDSDEWCMFWKGHDGDHSFELASAAARLAELQNLLQMIRTSYVPDDSPIAALADEALNS